MNAQPKNFILLLVLFRLLRIQIYIKTMDPDPGHKVLLNIIKDRKIYLHMKLYR